MAFAHIWGRFLPVAQERATARNWPRYFDFGITGVVLFFCISGFVIYGTLRGPRPAAGRRFLISRFFRLFPAYWVSVAAGLVFIWWWQGWPITWPRVAANVTMLPTLFHQPQVMGLYWTLETELAFYASCWVIWRLGWLDSARVLALLVVGASLLWFVVKGATQLAGPDFEFNGAWKSLPRHLGIMFWGAYFRVVYDESNAFRGALRSRRKFWILLALTFVILAVGGARQYRFFIRPSRYWFSPYVVGPMLFWLWVVLLKIRARPLAWLGQISYSLYLFHLVVATPLVWFVTHTGNPWFRGWPILCYELPTLTIAILGSTAVYYAVELPAIALGKRLAGRRGPDPGAQAAP